VSLTPAQIMERLEEYQTELGTISNEYADVAERWTRAKRERELAYARAYMSATGQVTTRKEAATLESENVGLEDEARFVGLKGRIEVINTAAMIGMALLKAHGRT
jgi:hypothetical protein